jgi:hypothetical protein
MTALIVRLLLPLPSAAAQTAQAVVDWYAGRGWTLWVLLIALPFGVLLTGGVTLLQTWSAGASGVTRLRPATLLIAVATQVSGVILAVVAVHMLMN